VRLFWKDVNKRNTVTSYGLLDAYTTKGEYTVAAVIEPAGTAIVFGCCVYGRVVARGVFPPGAPSFETNKPNKEQGVISDLSSKLK
jgi:hypothetical protein